MRERLDCAVLLTGCTLSWIEPILGQYGGGRLHIHRLDVPIDIGADGAHAALGAASMVLRRYDACLLPVAPSTLSWARTALAQAQPHLHTPVMALVRDLSAAGLYDLCELGLADFLREPFCGHEARVRIERLLDDKRHPLSKGLASLHVAEEAGTTGYVPQDATLDEVCENILAHGGPELEAYARAAASRWATSRESFREAKSKVIERFERAYITASLGRHGGNIAMAARAAQKHRRAFWALMRKYGIDAAPFRAQSASAMAMHQPRPCGDTARQHHGAASRSRFTSASASADPFRLRGG